MSEKIRRNYQLLKKWMFLRNNERYISEHPQVCGKKIAIYAMGDLGYSLLGEFQMRGVQVDYVVDRIWKPIFADCDMITPNDELKAVDAMIITAVSDYESIKESLKEKIDCEFISLETIINELYEMEFERWGDK